MAQELPAIAVAPGAAPKVKQSNEQQGGTDQLDAFRNALQTAIGVQSPEAGKTTNAPEAKKAGGKEVRKDGAIKEDKDAQQPDATDVLQIFAHQPIGVASIDLAAMLASSLGSAVTNAATVATTDQQTGGTPQATPGVQSAPAAVDAAKTATVLAQSVAQVTASIDDAVKELASIMTSAVHEDEKEPAASTATGVAGTGDSNGKEIALPLVPVPQMESAPPEMKPLAQTKGAQQPTGETKEQPVPGKAPSVADILDTRSTAKEPAVLGQAAPKIQTEETNVVVPKVQSRSDVNDISVAAKTPQTNETARPASVPGPAEQAYVKQVVATVSQAEDHLPAQHETTLQAKSVTAPADQKPTTRVEEDRPSQNGTTSSDGSGKKESAPSSASQAGTAAEPDRSSTFTLPRSSVNSSGAPVGMPVVSEGGKEPRVSLPIPLPRELSRAVLDQVVKGMTLTVTDTTQEVRVSLKPESLGDVVVKMKMEDGHLQAQIDVAQPAVKATVESQIADLRQALQDRGIDVQRIDVVAAGQSSNVADGQTQRGGKYKQKGGKRQDSLDVLDEVHQARSLGYNTLEVIM